MLVCPNQSFELCFSSFREKNISLPLTHYPKYALAVRTQILHSALFRGILTAPLQLYLHSLLNPSLPPPSIFPPLWTMAS